MYSTNLETPTIMSKKINSLEELRREKELIRLKMKLTREAFRHSLNNNRRETKRLLINRVALPVGVGALTSWLIQLLTNSKEDVNQQKLEASAASTPWWVQPARMLIGFLESYLEQIAPSESPIPADNGLVREEAEE